MSMQVLHEALTGQHCGWRRALQFLDARFSDTKPLKGVHARPCILLVDELDLLVTRNQSVRIQNRTNEMLKLMLTPTI